MNRPPRAEPTRISPYFFTQLSTAPDPDAATDSAPADAGDATADAVPQVVSPSSASPPPPPVVRIAALYSEDGAALHRPDAATPAPVFVPPVPRDLQAILWDAFTPPDYANTFTSFLTRESDVTERLRCAVTEAWESVSALMERNKERRGLMVALAQSDAPWRGEVRSKLYWQSDDIVSRYRLEVGGVRSIPTGGALTVTESEIPKIAGVAEEGDDGEHVVLDFSVLKEGHLGTAPQRPPSVDGQDKADDGHEDAEEVTGSRNAIGSSGESGTTTAAAAAAASRRAKAWTASVPTLLDPSSRANPLRRLFAPLQRSRDSLPKWTTLLLRDVLAVQQKDLPSLEARLQQSVLFRVPLHRPFLEARAALQACVTRERAAMEVEAAQVPAYRQMEHIAKRLYAFLQEQREAVSDVAVTAVGGGEKSSAAPHQKPASDAADGTPAPTSTAAAAADGAAAKDEILDMGERWARAEALWTMLLGELDSCKQFTADAVPRCADLYRRVEAESTLARQKVDAHREACAATLARLKAEAATCAELLTRNGERILAAVAEMEESYAPASTRLKDAIARRHGELAQLESQQEKNIRRVREALKACFVDQLKYEETAQALLQDELTLAQLETSRQQLRQAVQARHDSAVECERQAAELQRLLEDGDGVARSFFTACDAHAQRIANDDYYIQCRLVDQCTAVLQQRCRCLHAVAALYDTRYSTLEGRAGESWQLQFLLSGERDWAVANLADVRQEFALLEQEWERVRAARTALNMEAVELDAWVRTAEWAAWRPTLVELDAPPALQRRLPTLRGHTESLAHPAAGGGPRAARRLHAS